MKTTTVEPEQVDDRVVALLGAIGHKFAGPRGWEAGPVDVAALLRIAALVAKGMGAPFDQVVTILTNHWNELPDGAVIRATSALARARNAGFGTS